MKLLQPVRATNRYLIHKGLKFFLPCLLLISPVISFAQFSIAAAATNYTQNFNTLTNGTWTNNTTPLTGWYAKTDAGSAVTPYGANTGSTITGGLYAFGVLGTNPLSERALGFVSSTSFTGVAGTDKNYMGWRLKNNTGAAIASITITYTGEQWRKDNTVAQTLTVEYQTGTTVTNLNAGTWTSIPALSFTSPITTAGALALDGNAAANRIAGISTTVTVTVNAGDEIMIRWSDLNDLGTDHSLAIDDVTVNASTTPSCASPDALEFVVQPSNVVQDAVMSPDVKVRAYCTSGGATAAGYTGTITLTASNGGCGYTSQSVSAVAGVATFNNIKFLRSVQTGIKLTASATGFTAVPSNAFNVTAPGGVPTNTTIVNETFETTSPIPWPYSVGTPVYSGGAGGGVDNTIVKTLAGNKTLVKSYTTNNASGTRKSTNTITFNNIAIAAAYDYATFAFQIASLDDPSAAAIGAGVDASDDMFIEVSLDGGTIWSKLLTYVGNSDYLVPFSATVTSLAYNANVTYVKPSTKSSFSVVLPSGTTQFRFRMTATNNRINENWAIDNITLIGTSIPPGVPNPLPTITNNSIASCPNSNTTLSVITSNTQGTVTYSWPAIPSALSNPVVVPASPTVYSVAITDQDGCTASGTATVTMPGGVSGTWTGANNTDWFECANWGAGIVPNNTINVTIPAGAANIAEIDPLSAYAATFGGVARSKNITIDNKTLRLQANANLNVAGNLLIQNTALLDMTNGGTIDLFGSWTNTVGATGFVGGLGTINYAAAVPQTIATENYNNLTSSSTGSRTLPNSGIIGVANNFVPGTNTYTINGSTVDFNGAGTLQTVPGFTFYNVGFKNSGIKTLGGAIFVQKTLTMGASTTFALSSYNVTLRSVSGLTANVGTVPSTAIIDQTGSGRFVVERYVDPLRSWRLLTAPIITSQTIKAAWMEGSAPATYPSTNPNAVPNYGTHITGPAPGTNGFDASPQNNYSMKYYNGSAWVGNTLGVSLKTSDDITSKPGWMIFVRGNRSYDILSTTVSTTPIYTTLRSTGKINVGDMPSITIPAGFSIVANPYASAIDFSSVTKVPALPANDIFYVWDNKRTSGTTSTTVGGWVTLTRATGTSYTAVPALVNTAIDLTTGRIESGVAIAVNGSNFSSLTIKEADKSNSSALFFRPQPVRTGSIRTNLYVKNNDGTLAIFDGNLVMFNRAFSNEIDGADARKLSNFTENFGILSHGVLLAIDKRGQLAPKDTVLYNINQMKLRNYTLEFITDNLPHDNIKAILEDAYLHTRTPLLLQGNTKVDFSVTNDSGSYAANRFRIVFRRTLNFGEIKASGIVRDVFVDWQIEDAEDVNHYEVERSTDGLVFTSIGTKLPGNNTAGQLYNWLDKSPAPGFYYYRIKGINNDGSVAYSSIAKVNVTGSKDAIVVFPNPVKNNTIHLQFNNAVAGIYELTLFNSRGELVAKNKLSCTEGNTTKIMKVSNNLPAGNYQLKLIGPDKRINLVRIAVDSK